MIDYREYGCKDQDEFTRYMVHLNNPAIRLTPDNVRRIRSLIEQGARQQDVASMFNVKKGTIASVVRGKSFGWVE